MNLALPRLFASRALQASLALSALAAFAACGDPKPPPVPDPPVVELSVIEPNSAAPSLMLRVSVSGCDTVSQLSIYDQDTFLQTFPYTSGAMEFELLAKDIKYTKGIAVRLALNARATCSDGRSNVSQPQATTFLPVTKVIKDPDPNAQVVTDFFVADGSGSNISFIGCGNPTTGVGTLYRVGATGEVLAQVEMGIPCSPYTVITPLNSVSNKRWVWTPGVGAVAVSSNFVISGRTATTYKLKDLSVMTNGDAIVRDVVSVSRMKHTSMGGSFDWTYKPPLQPIATPQQKAEVVLVPYANYKEVGTSDVLQVVVATLDAATGVLVQERKIYDYAGAIEVLPVTSLSPDGDTVYMAFGLANKHSRVIACAANADGCEGNAFKWQSIDLPAPLQFLLPYAGGSRLAAIGLQRVWFLDTNNLGAVVNKDGKSLDTSGSLQVLQVQLGRNTSPSVILLNGAPPDNTGLPTLPKEIVAIDSAERGELFRYEVASTLSCTIDDAERLWMRVGNRLVQALPLSEYRAVRP
ncbi:hypothetical protein OV207_05125 [Corallococcus sp. BB11-1]|uniref:hypothetical protein n=1 Tax=Corallococcus sp. BB11-1 TaxID=2996783 RepID=UPI00226FC071|nr:hypothetical protein [Corallococcus sp. BB11-1]MCY1030829.1 hypothetical protein [Corallococcus sp. BB11-1]